jgi:mannose-6-phosphate isomerase-like protein (cupin superfamily)
MRVSRSTLVPLEFEELRIFDYTAGQSLSSSLAAIEVPPGARHAKAWSRRSDKYYLVSSGEIEFVLDGESQMLKAGDFCFVKRGRHFSYANTSRELVTLILVHTPSFDLRDEVFVESERDPSR